jgi:hypothetical protein
MVLTAWIIGGMVLPVRALFVKTIPEGVFDGMAKFNLEQLTNDDNCIVKLYAKIFRVKDEDEEDDK